MDNKSEKTFADLFSSSITDEDTNTQSFSDILNSGTTEEKAETSTTLTFDNLFDKIPSNETEIEQTITEIENNEPELTNFNPLFETTTNIESNELNNNEAITKETNIENDLSDNLFFKTKDTIENNTNSEIDKVEINELTRKETTLTEQNPSDNNNNLFFASEQKEEINKIDIFAKNDVTEKESEIETTTDNENNELNNNEEINLTSNPFIENKEEVKIENNIEIAPLFKEETTIEENPFFVENSQNNQPESFTTENNNEKNKENDVALPKKETAPQENLTPKSTSPFFEEKQKSEDNPFFQNQLNLIENQIPNKPSGNIDTTNSKHYNVKIVKKKESLIKFILSVLSYALFIFLLLIGIALLVYVLDIKIRAAKGDYSSPTFNAYVVLTGSMLPEIQVYDVVITKKVAAEKLKEGDVITFASADSRFLGTIITHRIIKKNPPSGTEGYTFQTRGDNNNVADNALVPANNIYGKVILKIPKLRYLQDFLASDGGWIIVILIPCLTVISYDIVKLMKGLKRKKYKNIKVQK